MNTLSSKHIYKLTEVLSLDDISSKTILYKDFSSIKLSIFHKNQILDSIKKKFFRYSINVRTASPLMQDIDDPDDILYIYISESHKIYIGFTNRHDIDTVANDDVYSVSEIEYRRGLHRLSPPTIYIKVKKDKTRKKKFKSRNNI